jgi:hypothetical protein
MLCVLLKALGIDRCALTEQATAEPDQAAPLPDPAPHHACSSFNAAVAGYPASAEITKPETGINCEEDQC